MQDEDLRAVTGRIDDGLFRGLIRERRGYYLNEFKKNTHDVWALGQLIELGQIDEMLIKSISDR
jgi:hypothetical protein